jgi:predicted porin
MTHADDSAAVTPTEDETSVGFGGKWESGKWEVGVGWETSKHDEMTEADTNTKDGTDEVTRMDIGMAYDLNDDMLIKFGYRQEKYDDDQNLATNENDTKSLDFKFEWNVGDGLEFDVGLQNFRYTHHDGPTAGKKTGTAAYVLTKVSF